MLSSPASHQALTATSNGFVDAYIIKVPNEPDWIIPQKIVLKIESVSQLPQQVVHDQMTLPVLDLARSNQSTLFVAIVEGETRETRFALCLQNEPQKQRLRISNLRDFDDGAADTLPFVYQTVLVEGALMQVPSVQKIEAFLFSGSSPE